VSQSTIRHRENNHSYNRIQQATLILNFILIYKFTCTVHHQESWYCIHSNWYLSY